MGKLELIAPLSYDFYVNDLTKERILTELNQHEHLNEKEKSEILQMKIVLDMYRVEDYVYTMTEHNDDKIIKLITLYINGVLDLLLKNYELNKDDKEKLVEQFLKYVYDAQDCSINIPNFPYIKLSEWFNNLYYEYFKYGSLSKLQESYFEKRRKMFKTNQSPETEKELQKTVKKMNDVLIEHKNNIPKMPNYELLLLYVQKAKNNYTLSLNLYIQLRNYEDIKDPVLRVLIFNEYLVNFYSNYIEYTEGSMFSVDKANHILNTIIKHKIQNKDLKLADYYTKEMKNMTKYIGQKTYWSPNKIETSTEAIQIFNHYSKLFKL